MYHPQHARPHRYLVPAAVAAIVVLVAGLVLELSSQRDAAEPPPEPDVTGAEPSESPATDNAVPAATQGRGVLDRCRKQHDAQAPLLRTAARSIKQWEVHVEAMNQLVAGEITLAQATDFWNRTRMGARARVADFREAEDGYAVGSHTCRSAKPGGTEKVRDCVRSVRLRERVVDVARPAIHTWARHVRDMELLRDGRLSPAAAAEMWRMNWRKGQDQIDAYHEALRRADRTSACVA